LAVAPHAAYVGRSDIFAGIVFVAIGLAALNDGLQTYSMFKSNKYLDVADLVLLAIFVMEVVLKVVAFAEKPWRYWIGREDHRWIGIQVFRGILDTEKMPVVADDDFIEGDRWWNCFDFTVVCVCIAGLFGGGTSIGFLRVLRLMRIIRLLRFWTELQSILRGLIGGLKASLPIVGLLLFIFFLYGTMGVTTFRENDPFHFKTLQQALYTLYTITNLEWLDVAAINMYGCGHDNEIYTRVFPADTQEANPLLFAALMEGPLEDQWQAVNTYYEGLAARLTAPQAQGLSTNADGIYSVSELGGALPGDAGVDWEGYIPMEKSEFGCVPKEQTLAALIYFVTFVIAGPLVMTTLFTGAVSMSMTRAVMDLQEGAEKAEDDLRNLAKATFEADVALRDSTRPRAGTETDANALLNRRASMNDLPASRHRRGLSMPPDLSGLDSAEQSANKYTAQVVERALDDTHCLKELEKSVGMGHVANEEGRGSPPPGVKKGGFGQKKAFNGRMRWLQSKKDTYLMETGEHRLTAALCSVAEKQLLLGQMLTARVLERLFKPQERESVKRERSKSDRRLGGQEDERFPGCLLKNEVLAKWNEPYETDSCYGGMRAVYARFSLYSWHVMMSPYFANLVNATIAFAALMVGLQTGDPFADYGMLLMVNEYLIKIVFMVEFVAKLGAEGAKPQEYFYDGWNCFGEHAPPLHTA
jgi:hypothetical protein